MRTLGNLWLYWDQLIACHEVCVSGSVQDCLASPQVKLEYYIREFLEPKERPEQALFPPGSGPAGNWR